MLFQGEDIAIRIGGEVDLSGDVRMMVYNGLDEVFTFEKKDLVVEDGVYTLVVPRSKTINMLGPYSLEVIVFKDGHTSIFTKDEVFTINRAIYTHDFPA